MTEYPPPPPGSYPPPPDGSYPPPYGGGYQPPPVGGYPPYAGNGPVGAPGTNGLAIASLACSVVGVCCGVGSIVGIVLGLLALNQIKQTGQAGRGLALAGVIVGAVMLVLGVVGYLILFSSGS